MYWHDMGLPTTRPLRSVLGCCAAASVLLPAAGAACSPAAALRRPVGCFLSCFSHCIVESGIRNTGVYITLSNCWMKDEIMVLL